MTNSALPSWSLEQLFTDSGLAAEEVAARRATEHASECAGYVQRVERNARAVREILAALLFYVREMDLTPAMAALMSPDVRVALRYLTAPPLSEADLCARAGVANLGLQTLANPARVTAILRVVLDQLDPIRIKPVLTAHGTEALAVTATAIMMASQQVPTAR